MRTDFQETYNLSNFQIAQLQYLGKTLLSEISKIIIMGILFHQHFYLYIFAILLLCLLRTSTGGLHCHTYLSCLAMSIGYIFTSIYICPHIEVTKLATLVLLPICILVNYLIGPVTSDCRPELKGTLRTKGKVKSVVIILIFFILTIIIPENAYLTVGFWIIILHTIQLVIAKIRKEIIYEKEILI